MLRRSVLNPQDLKMKWPFLEGSVILNSRELAQINFRAGGPGYKGPWGQVGDTQTGGRGDSLSRVGGWDSGDDDRMAIVFQTSLAPVLGVLGDLPEITITAMVLGDNNHTRTPLPSCNQSFDLACRGVQCGMCKRRGGRRRTGRKLASGTWVRGPPWQQSGESECRLRVIRTETSRKFSVPEKFDANAKHSLVDGGPLVP
jgi:hypothetical protein